MLRNSDFFNMKRLPLSRAAGRILSYHGLCTLWQGTTDNLLLAKIQKKYSLLQQSPLFSILPSINVHSKKTPATLTSNRHFILYYEQYSLTMRRYKKISSLATIITYLSIFHSVHQHATHIPSCQSRFFLIRRCNSLFAF